MKSWLIALSLVLFATQLATAGDLPDPSCCRCSLDGSMRLLMVPDENGNPNAAFSVTIINYDCETPLPNVFVEVIIGGQAEGKTRLCDGASTTGVTDENGFVSFNIAGGGCFKEHYAVTIRANGVVIRQYEAVVSPDYAGWDNAGIPGRSSLSMSPVDLAAFATAYHGGTGAASCHDYDNNGVTGPGDLAVFASAYDGGGTSCLP